MSYVVYASVTDDDDRRRQTPAIVTSLAPTLCVCGPVIINYILMSSCLLHAAIYIEGRITAVVLKRHRFVGDVYVFTALSW